MREDREAILFAAKSFFAAMLAYWIALRIGLTRPSWAITTAYIVANPLAGAVVSKAVFRLAGTLLGAIAAVVLVPTFVNEPVVLSGALALWLGLCVYLALLDPTPRSYIFLLAGYSASIIALPAVEAPDTIFDVAIVRVQEICIGIFVSTLVHSLVFPRPVSTVLLARANAILADAERWSSDALEAVGGQQLDRDRRRLANDISELHQLSIHLPFDVARVLPRVRTVRALQDQLSLLLPLASSIEDRIEQLRSLPGELPIAVVALMQRVDSWLGDGLKKGDRGDSAEVLLEQARRLEPASISAATPWRDMMLLNLLARLAELIEAHRDCRDLRDQLEWPGLRAAPPRIVELLKDGGSRALHLDRGHAARAGLATATSIGMGCAFWIGTAWADGATAALFTGICCALFAHLDRPAPIIMRLLLGSFIGMVAALIYGYAILPRVSSFEMIVAVLAPPMLGIGSLLARPRYVPLAFGMVLGFPAAVGLNAAYTGNFGAFINVCLAQLVGTASAVVCVNMFQTVGARRSVTRLVRACWQDVARRASGAAADTSLWLSLMLDRIGLLAPRLAALDQDSGRPLLNILVDLRVGYIAGELEAMHRDCSLREQALLKSALDSLGGYFRSRRVNSDQKPPNLLPLIDNAAGEFLAAPESTQRRTGLILLTSLRRNLFPTAPAFGSPAV
ncbi:FUSC family protein [Sphingobium sp. CCH11-B1]|uniref:FUSC family protein n=1 Tax=Sphingobium sp. CCH11-B1 TaxID=1768781 RepID=UPI00083759C1|nr:FUSC family protein [Sphingobium sp. CCH11-B1]